MVSCVLGLCYAGGCGLGRCCITTEVAMLKGSGDSCITMVARVLMVLSDFACT